MGLFGDMEDNGADEALYGEKGPGKKNGGFDDYKDVQRPLRAVCNVDAAKTGVSENEGSKIFGHPWFVIELSIDEIKSQGTHTPRNPKEDPSRPALEEGAKIQWFQVLPMAEIPPEKWGQQDKYNVRDVKACVAAVYGVDEEIMNLGALDPTTANNGEKIKGFKVGVEYTISTNEDTGERFANARFYAVDEDGNETDPLTPEETRAVMGSAS